jgi:hypothetical protein
VPPVQSAPWTQTLSLRWRPAVTFYATRIDILGEFDAKKALRAFRVGDDQIDARVLGGHELSVRHNGLTLEIFGQDADLDPVWDLLTIAVEKVEPGHFVRPTTQFQFIQPLDLEYEEAIALASASFLVPLGAEEIVDWALVVNLPGGPGTRAANLGPSVEFGVIRAEEARPRLTRSIGRTASVSTSALPGLQWQDAEFPPVGLFADTVWPEVAELTELAEVRAYMDSTRERACTFVGQLFGKIYSDRVEQEER